jgi:hypothetical protein
MEFKGHVRWMGLATLVGLSACRQPNPEWLGPGGGSGSSGEASSTGEPSSTGEATLEPTGPAPDQCAPAPVLGEGECPNECSHCDDGRCVIECGIDDCEYDWVECPDDWPCEIRCDAKDACSGADLQCGSDNDCTILCLGQGACEDASLRCEAGACAVTCGPQADACEDLSVECGEAATTVTCQSANDVWLDADENACACETVDCR